VVHRPDPGSAGLQGAVLLQQPPGDRPPRKEAAEERQARIKAGQITGRLPSERDLQQEFGTAPMTSRKAIRLLADEGLVRVRPEYAGNRQ
jgi:DNA-binding GntR family transcriptional regulator